MNKSKLSKLSWFNICLFGLVGQIAWNMENMYFNTFLYNNIYSNGASQAAVDAAIPVTKAISMMVAASAVVAVLTTFVMGTLSDRLKKRKAFISVGYIIWGFITAAFGFISRDSIAKLFSIKDEVAVLNAAVWTVIIMDSVMTFMGSTSNDSAFNAWITDITSPENRPKVETVSAFLPIAGMGLVVVLGTLAQSGTISYKLFFSALGLLVVAAGILGLFTIKEPEHRQAQVNTNYWSDLFYGFRPSVIKENSTLYLILSAMCVFSIAAQVFFPYMLIYIQYVILPTAGESLISTSLIICAVVAVVVMVGGILLSLKISEKKGKLKIFAVGAALFVVGLVGLGFANNLQTCLLAAAPTVVGYASLTILLNASIRDFTPKEKAGQFQGIRMIFFVLLPMVIGPSIGSVAIQSSAVTYLDEYGVTQSAPTGSMFIGSAIVALFIVIPLAFLAKKGLDVKSDEKAEIK